MPDPSLTPSPFAGRTAALGTKHGKEAALGPALHTGLGLAVVVPRGLDTDALGTFTGEVPRLGTPLETACRKAALAMDASGLPLGLASEGTFGPHPDAPFLTVDAELVVLVDRELGLEVVGRSVTEDTVAVGAWAASVDEALAVAARARFPSHALVVRRAMGDARGVAKGLTSAEALIAAVERFLGAGTDRVYVESDLRGHLNPTRMAAIARAADDLVANVRRRCPSCDAPGFERTGVREGLPCAWCGGPTLEPLVQRYGCRRCGHAEERPIAGAPATAAPMWCPACNP